MHVCRSLRLTQLGAKYGHSISQCPLPLCTYREIKAFTSQDEAVACGLSEPTTFESIVPDSSGPGELTASLAEPHPLFLAIDHFDATNLTSRTYTGDFDNIRWSWAVKVLHTEAQGQPKSVSHAMVSGVKPRQWEPHAIITEKMLTRSKSATEASRAVSSDMIGKKQEITAQDPQK